MSQPRTETLWPPTRARAGGSPRGSRVAALIALVGAIAAAPASAAPPPGELVVAGALLRQQFDPTVMIAVTDYTAFDLLYDGLLNLDAGGKRPGLATAWTVSPDGKQIDFTLRTGVKFHNGDAFSAEDVKYTYEKLLEPGNTHSYRKAFASSIERTSAAWVKSGIRVSCHSALPQKKGEFAPIASCAPARACAAFQ